MTAELLRRKVDYEEQFFIFHRDNWEKADDI